MALLKEKRPFVLTLQREGARQNAQGLSSLLEDWLLNTDSSLAEASLLSGEPRFRFPRKLGVAEGS